MKIIGLELVSAQKRRGKLVRNHLWRRRENLAEEDNENNPRSGVA